MGAVGLEFEPGLTDPVSVLHCLSLLYAPAPHLLSPSSEQFYYYESEGRRFESCRARYEIPANTAFLPLGIKLKVGLCQPFDHLSFSKPALQGVCACDLKVPILAYSEYIMRPRSRDFWSFD
jgi:hypothetical protein